MSSLCAPPRPSPGFPGLTASAFLGPYSGREGARAGRPGGGIVGKAAGHLDEGGLGREAGRPESPAQPSSWRGAHAEPSARRPGRHDFIRSENGISFG